MKQNHPAMEVPPWLWNPSYGGSKFGIHPGHRSSENEDIDLLQLLICQLHGANDPRWCVRYNIYIYTYYRYPGKPNRCGKPKTIYKWRGKPTFIGSLQVYRRVLVHLSNFVVWTPIVIIGNYPNFAAVIVYTLQYIATNFLHLAYGYFNQLTSSVRCHRLQAIDDVPSFSCLIWTLHSSNSFQKESANRLV